MAVVAFLFPNSNQMGEAVLRWFARSKDVAVALGTSALVIVLLLLMINSARDSVSAFIYFNF